MGKQEPMGYALLVKPAHDDHNNKNGAIYSAVPAKVVSPHRRSSPCKIFLYVTLSLLALFVVVGSIVATCGYVWTSRQVRRFTVTDPVDLPVHQLPDEELEVVKDRAKLFVDEIIAGNEPEQDLTITVDEMNGLVAQSDYLRGNMFFTIQNDKVSAEMSLPAKFLPGGKDRYFVATGDTQMKTLPDDTTEVMTVLETVNKIDGVDGPLLQADVHVFEDEAGEWVVNVLSGQFLDMHIPQDWIDKKENLLDYIDCDDDDDDNEDVKKLIHGIAGIDVTKGQITIRARRGSGADGYGSARPMPVMPSGGNRRLRGLTQTHRHYSRMLWKRMLF